MSSSSLSDGEENTYLEELQKHHLEITKNLDLDRQYILSHLRSKFVLDDEDCQLIKCGASRQQKASKFIDILMTKGPDGFSYFIEALEIEHPHLYEVITGNKPVGQRINSYETQTSWAVMPDKAVMDFDREFLAQELIKHADTNRKMTYAHKKLIREKMSMERKLDDVSRERDNLMEDLHMVKKDGAGDEENSSQDIDHYMQQIQELMRVNFEKSSFIIRLQSKLLQANETLEHCKKNNDELHFKNENLMQQVRDLTINYDFQRTQSRRLSEQVDINNSELKIVANTKREIHSLKFELARVKEEKDAISYKLEEFREVVAAMNVKCDILQKEKTCEEEKRGEVCDGFRKLHDRVKQLEVDFHNEHTEVKMLLRKNERLTKEMETHKEQRDFYLLERRRAIRERDELSQERDDALHINCELQKSRDEAVQKQISMAAQYEKKHTTIVKDLERTAEELKEWKVKALCLMKQEKSSNNKNSSMEIDRSVEITKFYIEQNKKFTCWKDRRSSELLDSAYKKLGYSEMNQLYPATLQPGKSPEGEVLQSINFSPTLKLKSESKGNKEEEKVEDQNVDETSDKSAVCHPRLSRQFANDTNISHLTTSLSTDEPSPRYRAYAYDKTSLFTEVVSDEDLCLAELKCQSLPGRNLENIRKNRRQSELVLIPANLLDSKK